MPEHKHRLRWAIRLASMEPCALVRSAAPLRSRSHVQCVGNIGGATCIRRNLFVPCSLALHEPLPPRSFSSHSSFFLAPLTAAQLIGRSSCWGDAYRGESHPNRTRAVRQPFVQWRLADARLGRSAALRLENRSMGGRPRLGLAARDKTGIGALERSDLDGGGRDTSSCGSDGRFELIETYPPYIAAKAHRSCSHPRDRVAGSRIRWLRSISCCSSHSL